MLNLEFLQFSSLLIDVELIVSSACFMHLRDELIMSMSGSELATIILEKKKFLSGTRERRARAFLLFLN